MKFINKIKKWLGWYFQYRIIRREGEIGYTVQKRHHFYGYSWENMITYKNKKPAEGLLKNLKKYRVIKPWKGDVY